jgi:hypothetical protein
MEHLEAEAAVGKGSQVEPDCKEITEELLYQGTLGIPDMVVVVVERTRLPGLEHLVTQLVMAGLVLTPL